MNKLNVGRSHISLIGKKYEKKDDETRRERKILHHHITVNNSTSQWISTMYTTREREKYFLILHKILQRYQKQF